MDLLYAINKKKSPKSNSTLDSLSAGQTICRISCRNIVAFTTRTELDDTCGKTWGCHVYVCDLNMPWNVHKIYTNKCLITALEWDLPGEKLVITDATGWVRLWTFKDYLLNEWSLIGSHYFPGEFIMAAVWFHNGKKTTITDKTESVQYNEKFVQSAFAPSVRQFGGQGAQGVLVVSNTGMLGSVMITQDVQNPLATSTESLGIIRQKITAVDLAYGKNGQFLVAVSSENISQPIRCYRVVVRKCDERCSIISQQMTSFFLQDGTVKDNPEVTCIMYLKFVLREASESLVIGFNNESGGFVEIWKLTEESHTAHKFFQAKTVEAFKTLAWQFQSQYRCHSSITSIATTKMSLSMNLQPTNYVIVALSDASIHCLSHDGLKEVTPSALISSWRNEEPSNKYLKTSATISSMDVSSLGCTFLLNDTRGSLYVYKLLPEGSTISLNYACTLLEYCLVTGIDWLDILFCMRSSIIEPLCERFEASYNRQAPAVQQFYYNQFLSIKTSLYRMLPFSQQRAVDLSNLKMVHSVSTAFKSLLRPSEIISQDKGPAESLALVITENINDVDKILLHLDPKEFTVEPSTLQSLQQLIQWVGDLALNLLIKVPEHRISQKPMYELLKDHKALNNIRELLVLIRIWGLLRPSCLPVFYRTSENLDVLALIFRLLSKLVQPINETQPNDELLTDECWLLPNQILVPQINQINNHIAVTSPVLFFHSLPMQFQYGVEPAIMHSVESNSAEGSMHNGEVVDIVRHLYLGKTPYIVRQCTRCGGNSLVQIMQRTAAIRSWDQRWARGCCCGGSWRLHKEIT